MMNWELAYVQLINRILHNGEVRNTRNGKVYSLFGQTLDVNLAKEFPLLRGRKMFIGPILGELAAILRGPKNVEDFRKWGCYYWDKFADADGNLNVDYGNAWINWNGVNQLAQLVETLKTNPTDRRMLVSGWRPDNLAELSLPCCHMMYQWYVRDEKYLDVMWMQRSVDVMVGLPSDVVLAAALTAILAKQCGYEPGRAKMVFGDTHIYANHLDGVNKYLNAFSGPDLPMFTQIVDYSLFGQSIDYTLADNATVENFEPSMLQILNYKSAPAIKFELNV